MCACVRVCVCVCVCVCVSSANDSFSPFPSGVDVWKDKKVSVSSVHSCVFDIQYQILSFRHSLRTSCISLSRNVISCRASTCCQTGQTGLAGSLAVLHKTCVTSLPVKEFSLSSHLHWTCPLIRWVWSHNWVWFVSRLLCAFAASKFFPECFESRTGTL